MIRPLRQIRESRGASKTWLGRNVGVTRQTVLSWEEGTTRPTKAQLFLAAHYLNVRPEEIAEYTPFVEEVNA
jgi:DNA-binding XRE family transcriptional regulator